MRVVYVILEWTPFPGQWRTVPIYCLQQAEFAAFNQSFYHQRAFKIGRITKSLCYDYDDALLLLRVLESERIYAIYKLWGYVVKHSPVKFNPN